MNNIVHTWKNTALNQEGFNFFRQIANIFGAEANIGKKRPKAIVSAHFYQSSIPEALSLQQYANVAAIIPKNSSSMRFPEIVDFIREQGLPVVDIDKDGLKNPEKAIEFIEEHTQGAPFYISDHGGYFAPSAPEICKHFDRVRFIGFTEYTHNGHVRFQQFEDKIDRPVVSVAELIAKSPADREAGETIAHIVDDKLRQTSGLKVANSGQVAGRKPLIQIGVIGLGRLGKSAVRALSGRDVKNIWVADTDPIKLVKAAREGFIPKTVDQICEECNVIISATGNAALEPRHYDLMRDNTYLATVTSPDDELDKDSLIRDGVLKYDTDANEITTYKIYGTERRIHLIADGESANTLCSSGIGDPTLFLPQATQIVANLYLEKFHDALPHGVKNLPKVLEDTVSFEWLRYFTDFEDHEANYENPWNALDL